MSYFSPATPLLSVPENQLADFRGQEEQADSPKTPNKKYKQNEQDQISSPKSETGLEDLVQTYRLNQNYFLKDDLTNQKNFSIVKGKDYVYFGGIADGVKHGYGVLITHNKNTYQGSFRLGLKMGKGYLKFSSGSVYLGDFVNSRPHGYGTFTYSNGQQYIGQFQNGLMHGNGMWISNKGDKYVGEWKSNQADGHGVHVWLNGDKYQGEFKDFLKHGYGMEKFSNGDVYKGNYQAGKPNGYGEYTWANGSSFKGEFKAGLRHGQGVWKRDTVNPETDSYEGQYQNDKKSGRGIFKWASGNVYQGQFFDDLRHGEGEMRWVDGTVYQGKWQKGLQHGPGQINFPGEGTRSGLFENNVMVSEFSSQIASAKLSRSTFDNFRSHSNSQTKKDFRVKSTSAFIDNDLNVIPESKKTVMRKTIHSKKSNKRFIELQGVSEELPRNYKKGEILYRMRILIPDQEKRNSKKKNGPRKS